MAAWDRPAPSRLRAQQDAAVRAQVVDAVGPFSPWWRERLRALGRTPVDVASVRGLESLPAVGERDLCPDGDPLGAAALVLQAGEQGWALHAPGPLLRRALAQRLTSPRGYRAVVETDTRPTSFVWGGLGVSFPLASTRGDLDLLARSGARTWQLLGLTGGDVLVAGLPTRPSAALQALQLAALGAGAPAAFPGEEPDALAEALRLLPATVLALPAGAAAAVLDELVAVGAPLTALAVVLLVGAPSPQERDDVREALAAGGLPRADVLAVHAPSGHRLLWAECRPSGGATGLHTQPDLELVQLVDPETGLAGGSGSRETVVTQLGLRGSALLRWRTGDLAESTSDAACPSCRRTVPRVVGVRRAALVPQLGLRSGTRAVDLRAVVAAISGRRDVDDWRVVLDRGPRRDEERLLVHVVPPAGVDPADAVVAVARDVRALAGVLPSQVVLAQPGRLPDGGPSLGRRVLVRDGAGTSG